MGPYRCAVIGCGLAGRTMPQSHIQGYTEHPLCEIVLHVDQDPAKLKGLVPSSLDFKTLRYQKPEIVSICTTEGTHLEVFRRVMKHWTPRAFFIEKPLATSSEACEEMAWTCDDKGIVLAVNHARAWDADTRRIETPKKITYGGKQWRNDVHAYHLAAMFDHQPEVVRGTSNGLWADGEPLWGNIRRNTMVKAISDIIACVELRKPYPDGHAMDAAIAVSKVLHRSRK